MTSPAMPRHAVLDSPRFAAAFTLVPAPPEDRELSPYTGVTRAHWVAAADDLLLSAARFRSTGGARIDLPGRPSQQGVRMDGLEGFARTFLLAAFRAVGDDDDRSRGHLARYLEGLVSGTRTPGRDDGESWPVIGHIGRAGQSHVEAASIALSLHLTRTTTWDALAPDEQDRVDAWLRWALRHEPSSNNWYLFPLTIASFLEGVGRGDDETAYVIRRGIALIDAWYRGDGWYSDGDGQAFDHYIGWALHLYPMLHARLRADGELSQRLGGRLRSFLETFSLTFDRSGAPLYLGRSMTYRMGTLASVAIGEVTGHTPLGHGESRRILSAGLRYFLEHDATTDGVLNLGWHGPHEPTLQRYSGPGSPYWASKGFAALMLPADHPVWTSVERPRAVDHEDVVRSIGGIGWLVQTTALDGIVRVHNHGSDHLKPHEGDSGTPDPLYSRFAYGTRTGPTALHNAPDHDVQVNYRDTWSARRRIHLAGSGDNWVASWHAPRFPQYSPFDGSPTAEGGPLLPSVRIESAVVVRGRVEVRLTRFAGLPPKSPVKLSGWAVAGDAPESINTSVDALGVSVAEPTSDLVSRLVGLAGWTGAGSSTAPYGTAFGRWAVVPELHGTTESGVMVALASLTSSAADDDLASLVDVSVDEGVVTVVWTEDGRADVLDLDALRWGGEGP
jgi:hypothetical protein